MELGGVLIQPPANFRAGPYAERCSVQPQQCTAASPTPTGSSVPAAPYCAAVEAFNADMSSMLTATQLSALTSGIQLIFVSGALHLQEVLIKHNLRSTVQHSLKQRLEIPEEISAKTIQFYQPIQL